MRILKTKIDASRKSLIRKKKFIEEHSDSDSSFISNGLPVYKTRHISKKKSQTQRRKPRICDKNELATKNMIKNYGRAISNFAASVLVVSYIENDAKAMNIELQQFKQYAYALRDFIKGIEDFRNVLLITQNDTKEQIKYKKLFQKSAIIFMKYFSVNWIFSGKISYKIEYLKYRGPLLRRIKDPKSFTYLKSIK